MCYFKQETIRYVQTPNKHLRLKSNVKNQVYVQSFVIKQMNNVITCKGDFGVGVTVLRAGVPIALCTDFYKKKNKINK